MRAALRPADGRVRCSCRACCATSTTTRRASSGACAGASTDAAPTARSRRWRPTASWSVGTDDWSRLARLAAASPRPRSPPGSPAPARTRSRPRSPPPPRPACAGAGAAPSWSWPASSGCRRRTRRSSQQLRPEIEQRLADPAEADPERVLERLDIEVELVTDPVRAAEVIADAACRGRRSTPKPWRGRGTRRRRPGSRSPGRPSRGAPAEAQGQDRPRPAPGRDRGCCRSTTRAAGPASCSSSRCWSTHGLVQRLLDRQLICPQRPV